MEGVYNEQFVCSYTWTIEGFVGKLNSANGLTKISSTKFKSHGGNYLWSLNVIAERENILDDFHSYPIANQASLEVACSNLTIFFHEKTIEIDTYLTGKIFNYGTRESFNTAEEIKKIFLMDDLHLPGNLTDESDLTIVLRASEPFSPIVNHPELHALSCDFGELLKTGKDSDYTIVVDEHEFRVHRTILAARCEYFSLLFKYNETKGASSNVLQITDINHKIMSQILQYIYASNLDIGEELLYEVLTASDMYQIHSLKKKCEQLIINNLKTNNVGECMTYADRYNNEALKLASVNFLIKSVSQFNEDDIKLLQSNLLSVTCPLIVSLLSRVLFKKE